MHVGNRNKEQATRNMWEVTGNALRTVRPGQSRSTQIRTASPDCISVVVVVVVVVEWFSHSKRIIIVRSADLSDCFSLIFVSKMCVFV